MKFVDRKTGRAFYKFGITQNGNALKRFDVKYDERWAEFRIFCKASFWVEGPKEEAEKWEKHLLSTYPKNIWLEKYLDDGDGSRDWDDLSGITEIFALHHGQGLQDFCDPARGTILSSYRAALDYFFELKDRIGYGIEPPPILESKRCSYNHSLSYKEVEDAGRR